MGLTDAGFIYVWSYGRIQSELANFGHESARSMIADILRRNGVRPAPERKYPKVLLPYVWIGRHPHIKAARKRLMRPATVSRMITATAGLFLPE